MKIPGHQLLVTVFSISFSSPGNVNAKIGKLTRKDLIIRKPGVLALMPMQQSEQ